MSSEIVSGTASQSLLLPINSNYTISTNTSSSICNTVYLMFPCEFNMTISCSTECQYSTIICNCVINIRSSKLYNISVNRHSICLNK